MNNSPHITKTAKGRPNSAALQSLGDRIYSLEKRKEERDVKLQKELEIVLENISIAMLKNKIAAMLENKLATMLDNEFASFDDKIQRQINSKIKVMENKMELMEVRIHAMEK